MPELPEVETVKRSLKPLIEGRAIAGVEIYYGGIIKKPEPAAFRSMIKGKLIKSIQRRGKYLLFQLHDDYTLVIHLRMTGQLVHADPGQPLSKHTHLIFNLSDDKQLRFVDVRKFGMVYLIPTGSWQSAGGLGEVGYEPLEEDFTLQVLQEMAAGKKTALKSFLLNQKKIAGIGNIYADEILFAARLHPHRRLDTLDLQELERLYEAVRAKLAEGIAYRGTSVRDYVDGRGEKGGFQKRLKVYDRGNLPCLHCGTKLIKTTVAGRSTVYCPQCQR